MKCIDIPCLFFNQRKEAVSWFILITAAPIFDQRLEILGAFVPTDSGCDVTQ